MNRQGEAAGQGQNDHLLTGFPGARRIIQKR